LREDICLRAEGLGVDGETRKEPTFFLVGELVDFLEISAVRCNEGTNLSEESDPVWAGNLEEGRDHGAEVGRAFTARPSWFGQGRLLEGTGPAFYSSDVDFFAVAVEVDFARLSDLFPEQLLRA
jgi:hypothetical protein